MCPSSSREIQFTSDGVRSLMSGRPLRSLASPPIACTVLAWRRQNGTPSITIPWSPQKASGHMRPRRSRYSQVSALTFGHSGTLHAMPVPVGSCGGSRGGGEGSERRRRKRLVIDGTPRSPHPTPQNRAGSGALQTKCDPAQPAARPTLDLRARQSRRRSIPRRYSSPGPRSAPGSERRTPVQSPGARGSHPRSSGRRTWRISGDT